MKLFEIGELVWYSPFVIHEDTVPQRVMITKLESIGNIEILINGRLIECVHGELSHISYNVADDYDWIYEWEQPG